MSTITAAQRYNAHMDKLWQKAMAAKAEAKATSDHPKIDHLRGIVEKLLALLNDPQPGLITWCQCYAARMQEISDFWNQKRDK